LWRLVLVVAVVVNLLFLAVAFMVVLADLVVDWDIKTTIQLRLAAHTPLLLGT
jgi:hypothetical protein